MFKRLSHFINNIDRKDYRPKFGGLEILKFLGPGLLVTVGFIDPGNWASNLGAGAQFGQPGSIESKAEIAVGVQKGATEQASLGLK